MTAACDRYLPPDLPAERVAARIGLVSDTHMPERCLALPPALFEVLQGVDLLLHAGDIGELWVLDRLSAIAPVIAVHGNDDTADAQRERPFVPCIDWKAGFAVAHSQFGESIMTPDLEAIWKELDRFGRSLDAEVRAQLRAGMRRILERCWSGEQEAISRADLLAAEREIELPAEVRARVEEMLVPPVNG